MRTTIDLPDELHRKAKAEAALRGMKFREYTEALFRQGLPSTAPVTKGRKEPIPVVIPVGRISLPDEVTNAELFEALDREDDIRLGSITHELNDRSA